MSSSNIPSRTTAKLAFMVPPKNGERAFMRLNVNPATGKRGQNIGREHRPVVIENLRGKEYSVTLDTAGFQFYHHPAKHTSFSNDEEIKREYYPESIELLKALTGASKVLLFDHTVRRHRPGQVDNSPDRRQPVSSVHADQTYNSATERVHRDLPTEAEELLKKRFQIINLWRPISHPAWDWPLTLCDYRSVDVERDLFPVTLVSDKSDREGEACGVKYNPNHKWKYLKGMTPEEFILIKCFDSISDGSVASYTPHTGFEDPSTPEGCPLRESIELRALVFYD